MSKFVNYGNGLLDMSFGMQKQPWMLLNLINNDDMLNCVTDSCHGKEGYENAFQTQVKPFYNGRERGWWFKMWMTPYASKKLGFPLNHCLNMVWFEHRNSDSMIVFKWEEDDEFGKNPHKNFWETEGSKGFKDIAGFEDGKGNWQVWDNKWQYTKQFEYLDFQPMLKYFWGQVEDFIVSHTNGERLYIDPVTMEGEE